jgi:hypothetical protein
MEIVLAIRTGKPSWAALHQQPASGQKQMIDLLNAVDHFYDNLQATRF